MRRPATTTLLAFARLAACHKGSGASSKPQTAALVVYTNGLLDECIEFSLTPSPGTRVDPSMLDDVVAELMKTKDVIRTSQTCSAQFASEIRKGQ